MNISHSSHRRIFQAKHRNTAFYNLYEAEDDLITQLTTFINSLFAPLTWILQQTLYRRVHKQDKGWIKIDFLHRNKRFQSIFRKFEIPSHCRRRKNFINKAIEHSMIKRKRNLIKRRKYLKVSQELRKVVYLEFKGNETPQKSNQLNLMNEKALRQIIGESLRGIIDVRRQQQNPNKMQIQGQDKSHLDFQTITSQIVFEGSLIEDHQTHSSNPNQQSHQLMVNRQNPITEVIYRWCFIYFPSLYQHQVQTVLKHLQNTITSQKQPQKIEIEQQMNNLNITQESIDKHQNLPSNPNQINIIPLSQMITTHYPTYTQVCEHIGHSHVDYRKQTLKNKQKLRQKQKTRLLESRYIDDKIDLVNDYHVKLQIEKQKRTYWEKRNKMIQEKIRKRQQKRKNRANSKNQDQDGKKDLTFRLKQLFNIDQPIKPKYEEKPIQVNSQEINENHSPHKQNQIQQDEPSPIINPNTPGFKIILPNYHQSPVNPSQINSQSQNLPQIQQQKIDHHNLNQLQDSDNQDHYDDMDSSGEEFQLPKKKKPTGNSQTKKHKKIVKPTESILPRPKQQTIKHSASKSIKMTQNNLTTTRNGQALHSNSSKNTPHSNPSYNLRHKSPSQGSYLKMAGYTLNEDENSNKKKQRNQIYEDDSDQRHDQSSSRNMRPRRS